MRGGLAAVVVVVMGRDPGLLVVVVVLAGWGGGQEHSAGPGLTVLVMLVLRPGRLVVLGSGTSVPLSGNSR